MISIYSNKPFYGKKIMEFKRVYNLLVLIAIVFFSLFITLRFITRSREMPWDVHLFFNLGGVFLLFPFFIYSSLQTRSLWDGGLIDPWMGAFKWEEIASFSLSQEGPYQHEGFYSWLPKNYNLRFAIIKTSFAGYEEVNIAWKVREESVAKIIELLNEKMPHKGSVEIIDEKPLSI